jgi:PPP family 3-phenylpropionic acid transporter
MSFCAIVYLGLAFFSLPVLALMALYIIVFALMVVISPVLVTLSMNYITQGENLDFGLARGLGSFSYAVGAVILSQVSARFSPVWMSIICLIASLIFIWSLLATTPSYPVVQEDKSVQKKDSIGSVITSYPLFFIILVGFTILFTVATSMSTFLVNIIGNLGGDETFVGTSIFFMAASELPVMAVASRVMKKTGALPLIAAAGVFYLFRNCLIALAPNLFILTIGMLMQGFSYGLMTAVLAYYITDIMSASQIAIGQTLTIIMTSGVGSTLGNIGGGIMLDAIGLNSLFKLSVVLTVIGSMTIVLPILFSKKHSSSKKEELDLVKD